MAAVLYYSLNLFILALKHLITYGNKTEVPRDVRNSRSPESFQALKGLVSKLQVQMRQDQVSLGVNVLHLHAALFANAL